MPFGLLVDDERVDQGLSLRYGLRSQHGRVAHADHERPRVSRERHGIPVWGKRTRINAEEHATTFGIDHSTQDVADA